MKISTTDFITKICFTISLAIFLISCGSVAPRIGDQAVTTPDYRENRVFFAETVADDSNNPVRILKHAFELKDDEDREIKKLNPLGCIIRGVRIPEDLEKPRDIAVVLDIVTAGSESVTSLVAFYQRNVPGGQMLNFQDLLVYYDPEWDGVTPPWFRVRVLEVNAERNTRTQEFLDSANKLSGGLSGMIPHPVLPSVRTAIEASKLIFGNKKNKVLIDYQVQFYSPSQKRGAQVSLTPLRKGEWLVVGRAKDNSSEFWNKELMIDEKTLRLKDNTKSTIVEVPYVSLVLMSADASIPKHIMDRSLVLLELLDSSSERTNYDALGEAVQSISSSLEAYKIERRVKKYQTNDDFRALIRQIEDYKNSLPDEILRTEQIRSLVRLVDEMTQESLNSIDMVITWWHADGGSASRGKFENADPNIYPHGTLWTY